MSKRIVFTLTEIDIANLDKLTALGKYSTLGDAVRDAVKTLLKIVEDKIMNGERIDMSTLYKKVYDKVTKERNDQIDLIVEMFIERNHFDTKEEVLLAALTLLFEKLIVPYFCFPNKNPTKSDS